MPSKDLLAEIQNAVKELVTEHYGSALWATVVIHLGEGVPDVVLPVVVGPSRAG